MLNLEDPSQRFTAIGGSGADPQAFLNTEQRGEAGPNGKPSMTIEQAGLHLVGGEPGWSAALGVAYTVTYAFRSTAPSSMPEDTTGFSRFNAAQIAQTQLALQAWSDVANITFTRVGSGTSGQAAFSNSASILLANYATGEAGAAAFANYPGDPSFSSQSGDVWVNSTLSYNNTPVQGNYGGLVLVHELGHTIGLSHPGEYNAGDGVEISYAADAEYYEDSLQYTVMSYFDETDTGADYRGAYGASPMLDDISAAQQEYGANLATRTGDTVYGFNSTAERPWFLATSASTKLIFAVWDAGGSDTFDFSGFTQSQVIDLQAGHFSNVGGLVGNVAIAANANIENAIGGAAADVLIGNAGANILSGRAGNDQIMAGGGADFLFGGAGVDMLTGGSEADVFVYGAYSDSTAAASDVIMDFAAGVDRIDVSGLAASTISVVRMGGLNYVQAADNAGHTLQVTSVGAVEVSDIISGGTETGRLLSIYGPTNLISTQVGYDAASHKTYMNLYTGAGMLFEQDGYDAAGLKTFELLYSGDGGHAVNTYSGGLAVSQTGFAPDGDIAWANGFDGSGVLVSQVGYDGAGARTQRIDLAADGSRTIATFAGGVMTSQAGFAPDNHRTFLNSFSASGALVQQEGFGASGAKAVQIDYNSDHWVKVSHFDGSGSLTDATQYDAASHLLSTLARDPASGAYTLTGAADWIVLTAIPGAGTINPAGANTDIVLQAGFGWARIDDFDTLGADHDVIRVDHALAADYAQLLAAAQNVGGDVVITFDPHNVLNLHNLQISQLSADDFGFV